MGLKDDKSSPYIVKALNEMLTVEPLSEMNGADKDEFIWNCSPILGKYLKPSKAAKKRDTTESPLTLHVSGKYGELWVICCVNLRLDGFHTIIKPIVEEGQPVQVEEMNHCCVSSLIKHIWGKISIGNFLYIVREISNMYEDNELLQEGSIEKVDYNGW